MNPGSKAHRQGVEPGDHVVAINDVPVKTAEEAHKLVRNATSNLVLQLKRYA